jgi:sulfate permease, SulP family
MTELFSRAFGSAAGRAFGSAFGRAFGPWVHAVNATTLRADLIAGVLSALLVLPQAFAFASLAGMPPEYGLYTALLPCVVAALFGSSWHMVTGPTNANSLALLATLAPLAVVGSPAYIQLALVVTLMVGVMQWLVGVLRLGSAANFISPSALRGFMTGAAALIALHSLTDFFGLPSPAHHGTGALLMHFGEQWGRAVPAALIVSMFTLVLAMLLKRFLPRWPFMLMALIAGSALAHFMSSGAVKVVGPIPAIWPTFHAPEVKFESLPDLLSIAFALTIVALGQAISVAKTIAAKSGQAIDANREFRAQGAANIVGGFFSCYVACGSVNRSMPNYEAGARTPLAAVFSALLLLLLLAFSAPLLAKIALPAIAALLLLVAWSLFDVVGWKKLWQQSRADFSIAAVTALATVTIRLEMAILLGTMLSLVVYLHRTSRPPMRVMGFDHAASGGITERPFVVISNVASANVAEGKSSSPAALPECPQLKMIRMEGEVYFGAVPHVSDALRDLRAAPNAPQHLLVMAKSMNFIDAAAADLWRAELTARRAEGGDLYFHRPRPEVLAFWQRVDYIKALGEDHIFATKRAAIATIFNRLDRDVCARCTVRLFDECQALPKPELQT